MMVFTSLAVVAMRRQSEGWQRRVSAVGSTDIVAIPSDCRSASHLLQVVKRGSIATFPAAARATSVFTASALTSAPATGNIRTTCGIRHQPDRDRGHQLTMAAHHTTELVGLAVCRIGALSAEERRLQLIQSAKRGDVSEIQALMALGVNVGATDGAGRTALHWAASKGSEEAARCLVEGGALVNAGDSGHDTPLHVAVGSGHYSVVRLLLAAGADCNARNAWGKTPLHWAVCRGISHVVAALLEAGANMGARDESGTTPLDYVRPNDFALNQLLKPR